MKNKWLILSSPFVMYFIFVFLIKDEENFLAEEFGEAHKRYKKESNLVFPMFWKLF